jgi:cell division protein FtsB
MNKFYYLLLAALLLIIFFLLKSIFFGENNYSKRNSLVEESNEHIRTNDNLKKENEILEFEIKNAQDSNDHVENFARENLNLTYPEEEFISFKEEDQDEQK